jgi:trans-aconitate 2-methyltransferase
VTEPALGDTWNPDQYARFQAERSQPFFDLVGLVRARPGMRVVDLGCGTGQLTAEMHRRLGARETLGVDSSSAMLAQAGAFAGEGVRFEQADLRDLAARPQSAGAFDLVLSNAALQWVPEQAAVIEGLTGLLAPGGQIAIQVPSNEEHASHATAREVAAEEPFRTALGGHVRRRSGWRRSCSRRSSGGTGPRSWRGSRTRDRSSTRSSGSWSGVSWHRESALCAGTGRAGGLR